MLADENTATPADLAAEHKRLSAVSPIHAARFYLAHTEAILSAHAQGEALPAAAAKPTEEPLPTVKPAPVLAEPLPPRTDAELARLDEIELQHRRLAAINPIAAARYMASHSRLIVEALNRQAQGRSPLLPDLKPSTHTDVLRQMLPPRCRTV